MLVLSRKLGQQIVISLNGITATVEVLKVDGNRIRLGIAAPLDVQIKRSELLDSQTGQGKARRNPSSTTLVAVSET